MHEHLLGRYMAGQITINAEAALGFVLRAAQLPNWRVALKHCFQLLPPEDALRVHRHLASEQSRSDPGGHISDASTALWESGTESFRLLVPAYESSFEARIRAEHDDSLRRSLLASEIERLLACAASDETRDQLRDVERLRLQLSISPDEALVRPFLECAMKFGMHIGKFAHLLDTLALSDPDRATEMLITGAGRGRERFLSLGFFTRSRIAAWRVSEPVLALAYDGTRQQDPKAASYAMDVLSILRGGEEYFLSRGPEGPELVRMALALFVVRRPVEDTVYFEPVIAALRGDFGESLAAQASCFTDLIGAYPELVASVWAKLSVCEDEVSRLPAYSLPSNDRLDVDRAAWIVNSFDFARRNDPYALLELVEAVITLRSGSSDEIAGTAIRLWCRSVAIDDASLPARTAGGYSRAQFVELARPLVAKAAQTYLWSVVRSEWETAELPDEVYMHAADLAYRFQAVADPDRWASAWDSDLKEWAIATNRPLAPVISRLLRPSEWLSERLRVSEGNPITDPASYKFYVDALFREGTLPHWRATLRDLQP